MNTDIWISDIFTSQNIKVKAVLSSRAIQNYGPVTENKSSQLLEVEESTWYIVIFLSLEVFKQRVDGYEQMQPLKVAGHSLLTLPILEQWLPNLIMCQNFQ